MGLSFGGGSRTGTSRQATNAGFMLLGGINPALAGQGGFDNETSNWMLNQDPMGSILQGVPGVITYDQFGNPQPVGSNNLPTMLPSIGTIANYDTLFEKYDSGALSPSGANIFGAATGTATGNILDSPMGQYLGGSVLETDLGKYLAGTSFNLGGAGGGAGIKGGRVDYTAPANIGELASGILESLPPEFQTFVNNTLNASSPERTAAVMQEFEDALTARSMQNAEKLGTNIMDVYAAEGVGSSGYAVAAMKEMGLQIATELNSQIAAGKISLLEQQLQAMQIGEAMMNDFLSAGANEQANLVALENQKMAANASIIGAEIQAAASVQNTLTNALASLEAQRMASLVSLENTRVAGLVGLEGQRMNMLGGIFDTLAGQSAAEEAQKTAAYTLPYELLLGVQGQTTAKQKPQSGVDFGGLISAGASLGSASIIGGALKAGAGA